jgi:hypothetical protein
MVSGTENPVVVIKKFNFLEMRARKQDLCLGYPKNRSNYWKCPPFALYSSGNTQATAKFAYPIAMNSNTHNP